MCAAGSRPSSTSTERRNLPLALSASPAICNLGQGREEAEAERIEKQRQRQAAEEAGIATMGVEAEAAQRAASKPAANLRHLVQNLVGNAFSLKLEACRRRRLVLGIAAHGSLLGLLVRVGHEARLLCISVALRCGSLARLLEEVLVTARHLADDANGEAAVTRGTATNTIQGHTPHQHRRCSSSGTNPSYPHTQASAPARPPRPTTSLECPSRN